jgi:hypothetical protein
LNVHSNFAKHHAIRQGALSTHHLNACLHRGRILRETGGHVSQFTCKFHGFTWRLDGTLSFVPGRWDFPQIKDEEFCLPEAKGGVWGSFVFVNLACQYGIVRGHGLN